MENKIRTKPVLEMYGEYSAAMMALPAQKVAEYLDIDAYFILSNLPVPTMLSQKLEAMEGEGLVFAYDDRWIITKLGALLFARDLARFDSLRAKAVRIVKYKGNGKIEGLNDIIISRGYALSFDWSCEVLVNLLTRGEKLEAMRRTRIDPVPESVLRLVVASALATQNLEVGNMQNLFEVFDSHFDASWPCRFGQEGKPRVNEALYSFFCRYGLCNRDEDFSSILHAASAVRNYGDSIVVSYSWKNG